MFLSLKDIFDIAEAIASVATPITIMLTIRQLKLTREQVKKQSDSAAVNFVLAAEGQFDGMQQETFGAAAEVIRLAYGTEIDPAWTENELRAFVYLKRLFGHISRMVYIIHDQSIDVGMDNKDRANFLLPWTNELTKYKDHPIMRRIYENAVAHGDYNELMMNYCHKIFGRNSNKMVSSQSSQRIAKSGSLNSTVIRKQR